MFINVSSKRELKELEEKLKESFKQVKSERHLIKLGHQGGSWEEYVEYSEELNIWWLFSEADQKIKRYWNAFGIGNPTNSNRNIIIEINYPLEGSDNRIAGGWAVDESNKYYLYHSGKIAGGRKGIGKKAFLQQYTGEFINVHVNNQVIEKSLVAVLDESTFIYQIAEFVKMVAVFKYPHLYNKKIKVKHEFRAEFDGEKQYKLPLLIKANGNHGIVVNALRQELFKKGFLIGNNGSNGRIDLYLYNKQDIITSVFEIKTALSIQNICTAIGQLLLYSHPIKKIPRKIFVCPSDVNEKVKSLMKSIDIELLFFKFKNGEPYFLNLDDILKL